MEINSNILEALGLTLFDSLWQGVLILAIAFLGMVILRKVEAKWRHNFLLVCILMLPIGGVYSFLQHYQAPDIQGLSYETQLTTSNNLISPIQENSVTQTSALSPVNTSWMEENANGIAMVWLFGFLLFSIRGIGGFIYLNRIKVNAKQIKEPKLIKLLDELRAAFGVRTQVLLRESSKVFSPMVSGYFKPMIIFPMGLIQGLTSDEVEVILAHELAHLKRNDFLINLLLTVLRSIYFYHPAYWWLQSQLDNEREYASDEMVMSIKSNGLLLVKALAKTQEYKMTMPSLGFAGNSKNQLLKRVNRIMKQQQNPNWLSGVVTIMVLGTAFMLMSQSQKKVNDATVQEVSSLLTEPETSKEIIDDSIYEKLDPKFSVAADVDNGVASFIGNPFPNDTTSLAFALKELIQEKSPVKVSTNLKGEVTTIKRNGKLLKGDDFDVYEKAFQQLSQYVSNAYEDQSGQMEKLARIAGMDLKNASTVQQKLIQQEQMQYTQQMRARDLLNSLIDEIDVLAENDALNKLSLEERATLLKEQTNQLRDVSKKYKDWTSEEVDKSLVLHQNLQEQVKQMEKQAKQVQLSRAYINEVQQLTDRLNLQFERKERLEERVAKIQEQLKAEGLPKEESDRLLERMTALEKEIKANAENLNTKRKLLGPVSDISVLNGKEKIKTEEGREATLERIMARTQEILKQDGVSKEESFRLMERILALEDEIGAYRAKKYNENVQKTSFGTYKIYSNDSTKTASQLDYMKVLGDRASEFRNDGLMVHTRVTPTYETFTFKEGKEREKWVGYAFEKLFNKNLSKKLFLVDGEVMKDWTFNDAEALDFNTIKAIDFAAKEDMKKHYGDVLSKKMLRKYNSVISIKTK
ncbi:M56 family metallopeptidase [Roseivirga sp.]|uniref:M56 family metallopeptidase n=1 Tax=Roseivirga sp. TaxID=1964215 RepID=UPI003B8C78B4